MNHSPVLKKQARSRLVGHVVKTALSLLILLGAGVGAWLLTLLREKPAETSPEQLVPQVRVAAVTQFAGKLDLSVNGTVVPHREVRVAAEVGGRITRRSELCRAGSLVQAGDLLVEIDRENYELALQTAVAEVTQSQEMLRETEKEIEGLRENVRLSAEQTQILKDDFDRNTRLGNVVSQSELDQSRRALLEVQTQHSSRENNLSTALARKLRMEAAVQLSLRRQERAQLDLDRTEIRAPFEGVVVRSMVEQDDFVTAGTVLLSIEDTSRVEVLCNLVETDLNWLRNNAPADLPGQTSDEGGLRAAYRLPQVPVTVSDSRYPDVTWNGRLDRFDGIGRDEMTKAIPVRIVVEQPLQDTPNGPRALVRGMYVQCRLLIETGSESNQPRLLSIPAVAVRPGGLVWIVRDGRIVSRRVRPVTSVAGPSGDPAAIAGLSTRLLVVRQEPDGLQLDDQVVVSPLSQPMDGVAVRIEANRGESVSPGRMELSPSFSPPPVVGEESAPAVPGGAASGKPDGKAST